MKLVPKSALVALAIVLGAGLTAGLVFATQRAFDVNLVGNVQLAISTEGPIQVFSGDSPAPMSSGDTVDFGVAEVDFFGRGPVPIRGPFTVKNRSNGPVRVVVTGDMADGVVPLFGATTGDLKPAPSNAFTLPSSGDALTGYLGLQFNELTAGPKSTTITFRATDVTTPTTPARIAFSSDRDGNFEIYVMDADGFNQIRLTNNTATDCCLDWSPDGSKIAFESNRDGGNWEVYVMDADGSNQTNLTTNSTFDGWPVWSPDGSKIAFFSSRDGNSDIYVMNADGSNPIRLTTNSATDRFPDWSPDDSRIAFTSTRDGNEEIYVMNANGSNQTRLTTNSAEDWRPDWSPDSSRIAFRSSRDGNREIYVMNANGSNQTRLTTNSANDSHPDWSPDGSKIVFDSVRDGNREIYVMNGDGANQTRITNNSAIDRLPAWSPGAVPATIKQSAVLSSSEVGIAPAPNEAYSSYDYNGLASGEQ